MPRLYWLPLSYDNLDNLELDTLETLESLNSIIHNAPEVEFAADDDDVYDLQQIQERITAEILRRKSKNTE